MKKLLILLSVLFLLTGCGKKEIYGEVLSVTKDGQYVQLVVRTGDERQVRILADGNTHVYSFAAPDDCKGLLSGDLIRPVIRASQLRRVQGVWLAEMICVDSLELPQRYTLDDGTVLTVRKDHSNTIYIAPDGKELLREQDPIGPDNVSVGGLPTFDMLAPAVQEAILAYYDEQELLYNLDAEIEKTYQWYLDSSDGKPFSSSLLSQHISPTAANNRLLWYITYVTRPLDGNLHQETRIHAIFDRQTGAVVEAASLFACSEAEAARVILDVCGMPETELRREMEQKFRFDYLNFSNDAMDVCFPAGSLVNHPDGDYILGIHYEDILNILHPWAVPDSIE